MKSRQQRKQYFEPHANGHTGSSVLLYGAEGRDGHGALKRLRQRFWQVVCPWWKKDGEKESFFGRGIYFLKENKTVALFVETVQGNVKGMFQHFGKLVEKFDNLMWFEPHVAF